MRSIIELGAGTGVISQALLAGGFPAERLYVVEIVPDMAAHLRRVLPGVNVIEGDARSLPSLIPEHWHGRVGTVVCGIPLVLLPKPEQRRFIDAIEAVAPGRGFLHYSYCATSPLPAHHGLAGEARGMDAAEFSAGQCLALYAGFGGGSRASGATVRPVQPPPRIVPGASRPRLKPTRWRCR